MKLFFLLCVACGFWGCNSNNKENTTLEQINEILIDPEKVEASLDLSCIFTDKIDIIPLEVTEECLISEIKRLEYYKNKIFISDGANARIFVFNIQGKFLKSIGRQGMGPGEYSYMGDFSFKGDSIIIQDFWKNKYIAYDLSSEGYREIPCSMHHLEIVSFSDTSYLVSNYNQSEYGYFNLYRFNLNNSAIISTEIPFEKKEIDKSSYGLRRYASKFEDTAMLIYPLNDTIYTLTKNLVTPTYVIHFTSRKLPENLDIIDKEMLYTYVHKNKFLKGWEFMQNSRNYLLGYYIDENFRYCIYDKQKNEIRVGKQLKMKEIGDIAFYDFYTTNDDDCFFILDADYLSNNWKYTREKCTNIDYKSKLDSIVSTLNEDSNPVLFIRHFKK